MAVKYPWNYRKMMICYKSDTSEVWLKLAKKIACAF